MSDRPEPSDPHPTDSGKRQAALGAIGFVATLVLLFGVLSFANRDPGTGGHVAGGPSPSVAASLAIASASIPPRPTPSAVNSSAAGSPAPAADPVLVGAGDIANCSLDADRATADLVADIPGTVFTAGDNAYDSGSTTEFRECYGPTWGRFLARTRPVPGNHDHVTKDLAGYLGYFGTAAAPNGTSWYSYDLGTWHIVVLDSSCEEVGGCGPGSAQGTWLTADLAASKANCTLAIWHHPRFSSGFHGNDVEVAPFWQALHAAGADVIVNGHDHDYERFAPQDPAGDADAARGLREFVVGTGGAEPRDFAEIRPNSVVRATGSYGVIRFELHPTGYAWMFTSTTGEFGDSGSGTCH